MDGGEILDGNMAVFSNVGGHSGDNGGSPLGFFSTELALIFGRFAGLNPLQNVVNLCQVQGLVPASVIDQLFYFGSAFSSSGEACNEIADLRHSCSREG